MSTTGWIHNAIQKKHKGALHRALHVPSGDVIPKSKVMKAEHANNPKVAKEARLAETLSHLHLCHGGRV